MHITDFSLSTSYNNNLILPTKRDANNKFLHNARQIIFNFIITHARMSGESFPFFSYVWKDRNKMSCK